ncbi:ATP-binding protein [Hephaestia caeni]|nr:ATP-binding protein [Hephaestia caeni]
MTFQVDMGLDDAGRTVAIDLEELLATRLLVQGNSGSGKSHLLRRLLEKSAGEVQQIVIDPEGDFVTLADHYGHVAIEAVDYSATEITRFAGRCREHRTSVVLSLEGLEIDSQMRCAAAFLSGLFDAPRDHWYPALVIVDEAQLFAPSGAAEVSEDARRGSLSAMANLMSRGRKRGLAGVIATQRLAKLSKNVAAEASNFLMGHTFLDIDMARAADLLGMERRQAEAIRDLQRGSFLGLGPAIARRSITVRIGAVETAARSTSPQLVPLPTAPAEDMRELLFADLEDAAPAPPPPPPPPPPPTANQMLADLARASAEAVPPAEAEEEPQDHEPVIVDVLRAIIADADSAARPIAALFQDFQVRCRMAGVRRPLLDPPGFARRLAAARAGIFESLDDDWADALAVARDLPDDMLGVFLLIARTARDGAPCPGDETIADIYGTSSLGRARRVLAYMESRDVIVPREDLAGRRSIAIPQLGWTTQPAEPA